MSTYEREISERCLDSRGAWSCRRGPVDRAHDAGHAARCLPPRVRSSQSAYLFEIDPSSLAFAPSPSLLPFRSVSGPSRPDSVTHTAHRPRRDAGEASVGGAHKSPSLLSPGCELAATAAELVCTVVCAPPSAGERERLSATGRSVAKRASLVLGVNRSRALSASRCWWSNVEMNGGTAF